MLRTFDFGESDRIVHLLTPSDGRLTAIAKGARRSVRRFAGTLDVFHHLRVQVAPRRRPGAMARLEQARLLGWHPALRRDPRRFALACYLLELLDRLAPEDAGGREAARLFTFARGSLALLETAAPDRRLRVLLELCALDRIGLRPELVRCVRCGRDATRPEGRDATRAGGPAGSAVQFHVAEGGPVCGSCAVRLNGLLPVRRGTLRALEQGLRLDLGRLERLVLPAPALVEAAALLQRFQRFHLGLELRSEPVLEAALG